MSVVVRPVARLILLVAAPALLAAPGALAATAPDLTSRIHIDGYSSDFVEGEKLLDESIPMESTTDSKWGVNDDINQIRITWDADYLYLAVDGIIWDNNIVLTFDFKDGGLTTMTDINSWRRNFDFGNGYQPDLFIATWDGNTTPRLLKVIGPGNVQEYSIDAYTAVASFSQGARGRAMEAAIPWPLIFGDQAERVFVPAVGDTLYRIPEGMGELRIVGFVTAGPDGTGGPDSAPDNLQGHTGDSANRVLIDNYAILPLDLYTEHSPADGGPSGDPDGFPDMYVEPADRVGFLVTPPVRGITFDIGDLSLARAIVSPEQNRPLEFNISLSPPVPEGEESFRVVSLTAEIYSISGRRVRTLYREKTRPASQPNNEAEDVWDGRDENGAMVPGGIYILQVVTEPGIQRRTRAFSVVR